MSTTDSSSLGVPTKAVYQLDETLRTHLTSVISIRPIEDLPEAEQVLFKAAAAAHVDGFPCYILETKETILYAQGGGQPFDTGYMIAQGQDGETVFNVEAVRYGHQGRILHLRTYKQGTTGRLKTGSMVEQHVNGERRDFNSRNHTAGHIIGLAVRQLISRESDLEGVSELKASHYPDACFVEFNGLMDGKFKDAIQMQATEFVKQRLPIKLCWYRPEKLRERGVITADGMPVVAGSDGKVRVVDIVGAGTYPCGETHVQDSSLVGNLTVRNIKRQKGVSEVSYAVS